MRDSNPRVTVVIPAYNQAQYLTEAVDSVLSQSYQKFELVVVDDGSTDDTPDVISSYGDTIRSVRQENQGLAGARNTGIIEARGELIGLLDSDDAWEPNYLRKMISLADRFPESHVFFCSVLYVNGEGRELPQQPMIPIPSPEDMYSRMLRSNFLIPSTIFMRREAVIRAGLFDPNFRRLQDWELWLRMLRDGMKFVGIPDRLVHYRLHSTSLSTDFSTMQNAARAMAEKLYGPDDGAHHTWSQERQQAWGGVYRSFALTSLQRGGDWDEVRRFLDQALRVQPELSKDLDLFYELALGVQPLGHRGARHQPDLKENEMKLVSAIEHITHLPDYIQKESKATAYLGLGFAAYNAYLTELAREYFLRAVRIRPSLLGNRRLLTPLIKSFLGSRIRNALRSLKIRNGRSSVSGDRLET